MKRRYNKKRLARAVMKTGNANLSTLYIMEFGLDNDGAFIINNMNAVNKLFYGVA